MQYKITFNRETPLLTTCRVDVQTFRHIKYTGKRYYIDCTVRAASQSVTAPDANWVPAEESLIDDMDHLETVAGVKYFGWL